MNTLSRTITGILMVFVGLVVLVIFLFFATEVWWLSLIYGFPLLIIGFFILFNKHEDRIEEREDQRSQRNVKGGRRKRKAK